MLHTCDREIIGFRFIRWADGEPAVRINTSGHY